MKKLAAYIAGVGFFALAAVAWAGDLPPHECALKGLLGAAVLYVILIVAGRLALNIFVSAVIDGVNDQRKGTTGHE